MFLIRECTKQKLQITSTTYCIYYTLKNRFLYNEINLRLRNVLHTDMKHITKMILNAFDLMSSDLRSAFYQALGGKAEEA